MSKMRLLVTMSVLQAAFLLSGIGLLCLKFVIKNPYSKPLLNWTGSVFALPKKVCLAHYFKSSHAFHSVSSLGADVRRLQGQLFSGFLIRGCRAYLLLMGFWSYGLE